MIRQDKPHVTAVQAYSVLATVSGLFTGILFNIHATPIGLEVGMTFVTVFFLALAYRHWLKNNHKRKFIYNGQFTVVMVLNLLGCLGLWLLELRDKPPPGPEPPKPHFRLVLKSATGWQNINLQITNEYLFSKEGEVHFTLDIPGHLVVPMRPRQTNLSLTFVLIPDSPSISDVAEVVISVPKYIDWSSKSGWSDIEFPSGNNEHTKSFGAKLDLSKLLPNDWVELPELIFSRPSNSESNTFLSPMHIRIRAKEMQTIFCEFWISFPILTDSTMPQIVFVGKMSKTNKTILIPFIRTLGPSN